MTASILLVFILVWLDLTQILPSKYCSGVFSPISLMCTIYDMASVLILYIYIVW
jgi:hypothetical protein